MPSPAPSPAEAPANTLDQDPDDPPPRIRELSDLGNAERFADLFDGELVFVPERKGWLRFDGRRWASAPDQVVLHATRQVIAEIRREADWAPTEDERRLYLGFARACGSLSKRKATIASAAAEPGMHRSVTDFDRDGWVLNLESGTMDLRTGGVRPHRPDDLITKLAPTVFDPDAECPKWMRFLDQALCGDPEYVSYLQRVVGYLLTGSTREHCLFVLVGSGANGKSTFVELLRRMLGDYATTAAANTFLASRSPAIRSDIAGLAGARFVATSEPDRDVRLDEATLKLLTGGDTVTSRFLYQEYFSFRPSFKLALTCNHLPEVRGTDDGIWRRMRLLPFDARIPPGERNPDLLDELTEELPGILAWAIEGCMAWQKAGLAEPQVVLDATRRYRSEMDVVGRFIEAECTTDESDRVQSRPLHEAFTRWAKDNGEGALSERRLADELKARGFPKKKTRGCMVWHGVGLRAAE